jgi:hypothetical protein
MPRVVTDIDVLQEYLSGVIDRADHHADNVSEICLAIAGAIVWRKDGDIRVYERQGQMTNALWVHIGGQRYALSYNHVAAQIEVREVNMQGDVLASFDNSSSVADVRRFFGSL